MNKKLIKGLIIISLILLLAVLPSVTSSIASNINLREISKVNKIIRGLDDDNLIDIDLLQEKAVEAFKKIVGDDSEIKSVGWSFVNSNGTGMHIGRGFRLIYTAIPINIGAPLWGFPRNTFNFWLIFANYNQGDATTVIDPLEEGKENITITGDHYIFSGACIFLGLKRTAWNLERFTDLKLPKVKYYAGKMFWHKGTIALYMLNPLWKYFIPTPLNIKFPLYTLIIPTSFRGFTPFVLWKEK